MKTIILLAILVATPASASDSGACYNLQDADARSYCIAKARKDPSVCYSIQSSSLRSMCLSEVRR